MFYPSNEQEAERLRAYEASVERRMLSRLVRDIETGCLLWQGPLDRGRGRIHLQFPAKGNIRVHRVAAWLWLWIDLDLKAEICHTCDVRHCCEPSHLYPGTRETNMADAAIRGRMRHKLTEDEVREIRGAYVYGSSSRGQKALARRYGVSEAQVRRIVLELNWTHV